MCGVVLSEDAYVVINLSSLMLAHDAFLFLSPQTCGIAKMASFCLACTY